MDKTKIDSLLSTLQAGIDFETSVHVAELSLSQVYSWLEKGKLEEDRIARGLKARDTHSEFLELWVAVKKARAAAIARNVVAIQSRIRDDWKAAAWWLERANPDTWGKPADRKMFTDLQKKIEELEQ